MEEKPIKKNRIGIIIALLVVVIGVGAICYGLTLLGKPTKIFLDSYEYLTQGAKSLELENFIIETDIKSDKISKTSDVKLELGKDLGMNIEPITFTIDLAEDRASNIGSYKISSKLGDTNLLNGTAYQKDGKIYFTIKELMEKHYYVDQKFTSILTNIEKEDIKVLTDIVAERIKKEIQDKDFEKEKAKLGKEQVNKLSLKLTDEKFKNIYNGILMDIKASDKAIEVLETITRQEKTTIIEKIDELINEDFETTEKVELTYNIYYKFNKIRKLELVDADENAMTYTEKDGNSELKLTVEEEEVFKFKFDDAAKKLEYVLISEDYMLNGTLTKEEKNYRGTFNVLEKNETLATIDFTVEKKNSNELSETITITSQGKEFGTITINTKVDTREKLEIEDLTNSKNFKDMTEEEQMKIFQNLMTHPVFGPILQSLSSLQLGA